MGRFLSILLVFTTLSCRRAQDSSYPEEGPFYQLSAVVGGPAVQAQKVWMAKGVQIVRRESFLIPVTFLGAAPGTTPSEGRVQFGRARKLCEDGPRISTTIVPVRGTSMVVLLRDEHKRRITVSVLDLSSGQRRELASVPRAAGNPDDGACAVTTSGRHVLLVGPEELRIWDVVNGRVVEGVEAAKGLSAVRLTLMRRTGSPGDWWLTDDLRYVAVEPMDSAYVPAEYGPLDAIPLTICGVAVDLRHDGVVFDRKAGTASRFPAEISPTPNIRVVDAEVVGGRLTLLYRVGPNPDLHVVVADGAGHMRASHLVKSFTADLAGWDPEHDQVWFWSRDSDISLPNRHPEADDHLIAWDVANDRERRFRIPVDQIQRAVDSAK